MTTVRRDLSQMLHVTDRPALDVAAFSKPPEWTADALCAQTSPDAFFPDKGGSPREAKKVCAACPVTAECLAYGMEHNDLFGIYGGVTERERRRMRRESSATPVCCVDCGRTFGNRNGLGVHRGRYCRGVAA